MRTGTRRTAAARPTRDENALPRPIRDLVIAYHEDEKGKPLTDENGEKVPAIVRSYRVCPVDMTVHVRDAAGKVHPLECKAGDLDWRDGQITVKEVERTPDGRVVSVIELSHIQQFKMDTRATNFQTREYSYLRGVTYRYIPRFNPHARTPAPILSEWQAQADSPDATWRDGRCPSKEEYEKAQAEYLKRLAERKKNAATGQATVPATGPGAVTDGPEDGEDFDEFND